jgi:hypothetical protein
MLETVRCTYRLRPGRIAQAALLAEFLSKTAMALKAADAAIGACKTELIDHASADDVRHQIACLRDGESDAV